jgi:hypothetical protein
MSKPTFLGPLVGKRAGKHELVHVESGAVLASRVDMAQDSARRRRGLLGRDTVPKDCAVIVAPCRIVHTFFMRCPVDVIFVAADGTVIKTCRNLRPWRLVGAFRAFAAIEAAAGFTDRSDTAPGDRVTLRETQLPRPARDVTPMRPGPDAVLDAVRDIDSDADPWGIGAGEPWGVELSKPVELAERVASQAATVRGTRAPEPTSAELSKPVESPKRAAGQAPTAPTAGARNPPRAESSGSVDLARLLARQTPIVWFEAVAIVQELCAEVVARGAERDLRVPELTEIAITPEGGIELLGDGPEGQAPVPRAGRVLLTLLAEAQTLPVQLRLLALQEVSPAPSCKSLQEFSTRLELFERPGRTAVVRSVYDRFQKLPALDAELAEDGTPSPNSPPALPRPLSPAWWRRRKVQAGAAAVLVAVLIVAMVSLWPRPEGQGANDGRGAVTRAVSATADTVAQAAGSGLNTVARWFGVAVTDRPTATAPAEPASVDASPTSAPSRRTAPRTARPVELPRAAEATPEGQAPSTDTTVYSPVDTEIVPPAFVRSRLPAEPPLGVRSEDLSEVEVVVSATGEVESVKLVTQPVRVLSVMMLSAVKNWRFQPATKDGQPVRYRMRMRLTNQ